MSLPPDTRSADTGVIHDIGYRGYTGPRLGRAYATRSLFTQSLRAAYGLGRSGKSKVLPMLVLGVVSVPAVVMVAIALATGAKALPLDYPRYLSSFAPVVSIFLASQAPVLLSRDLRYHTVPLYFSRPITRADYVRAKFAAMVCAQFLLMAAPLVVLYLGAVLGRLDFGHNTEHFLIGLVAALLYALVPSSVALVIAAATPRRGFGVAGIMGYLAISTVVVAILTRIGTATEFTVPDSAQWFALLSPNDLVESLTNQLFDVDGAVGRMHAPGGLGAVVFTAAVLAMVSGSYGLLLRRYRSV
ncbi:ABC-2 type transport system permease protein [Kitasatospora sp. MAA19]|uniref:ABC transporter permease n=1 Tax=unclassified Kitasatospora TaxID=2633591 RepID=UPI002473D323|nr:ABC-2 transporter permease [Kitasatospora sp. MAA19]MDH6703795.1 ABC-2 type transport system permease protein [Kitasatospora sp. MAA19]